MPKVTFETGQVVNFDTTPSQSDIEEVALKLGITKPTPAPQKTLGQKVLDTATSITNALGGKAVQETFGAEIAKLRATPEQKQFITQPSVKQTAGSALQLGTLFAPVGTTARAASLGAKALGLEKAAGTIGNVIAGATTGAGFDIGEKLQTGSTSGLGTALGAGIPLVGPAARLGAKLSLETLGKTTGAGFGSLKQGLASTVKGGESATAFREALRGGTTQEKIVEEARAGLNEIKAQRRATYLEQLGKISENKTSLDISPVVNEVGKQLDKFNINPLANGTLDFSRSTLRFNRQAQQDIQQIVDTMKGYGLKEGDRTAVGVDNLKQAISDLYSPSSQARAFIESIRKTTRGVLSQVEGYDELAKTYADKTDLIDDITKGLSLSDKASVDTSFNKLTNALRQDNQFRQELIKELDDVTGGQLASKLAGQQLSALLPQGISGKLGTIGGVGALTTGIGLAKLLPAMVAFSPRAVGELVSALGFTGNVAKKITDYLTKNAGKLQFPGDKAIEGIKSDVKTIKAIPNKQGGFIANPLGESKDVKTLLGKQLELEKLGKQADEAVRKFANEQGLISDSVKKNPDYIKAKQESDRFFKRLKDFNTSTDGKLLQSEMKNLNVVERQKIRKELQTTTFEDPLLQEAKKYKSAEDFISKYKGSATQYGDYTPEIRKFGLGEGSFRITDKGVDPNLEVTIYRGVPDTKSKIVDGDFVTTDRISAESYAGRNNVISKKVKAKDLIYDDPSNFDPKDPFFTGAEFVYSDSKNPILNLSDSELMKIWKRANK